METHLFCSDPISNINVTRSANEARVILLEIFRYSSKGGIEEKGETYIQNIALLFDQLIDLVAAAEALRQEGGAVSGSESITVSTSLTGQEGDAHE